VKIYVALLVETSGFRVSDRGICGAAAAAAVASFDETSEGFACSTYELSFHHGIESEVTLKSFLILFCRFVFLLQLVFPSAELSE
jgi:hypothetical protein